MARALCRETEGLRLAVSSLQKKLPASRAPGVGSEEEKQLLAAAFQPCCSPVFPPRPPASSSSWILTWARDI